jgi:hypothetical protein
MPFDPPNGHFWTRGTAGKQSNGFWRYKPHLNLQGLLVRFSPTSGSALPYYMTSEPFGDSTSAAARPKRWGVTGQAEGGELDPTRVRLSTLLT